MKSNQTANQVHLLNKCSMPTSVKYFYVPNIYLSLQTQQLVKTALSAT